MLSLTTVREQLNELFSFSIRVISLHDNIEWPTQSPDLNPYDFMRNKALVRRAVMYKKTYRNFYPERWTEC